MSLHLWWREGAPFPVSEAQELEPDFTRQEEEGRSLPSVSLASRRPQRRAGRGAQSGPRAHECITGQDPCSLSLWGAADCPLEELQGVGERLFSSGDTLTFRGGRGQLSWRDGAAPIPAPASPASAGSGLHWAPVCRLHFRRQSCVPKGKECTRSLEGAAQREGRSLGPLFGPLGPPLAAPRDPSLYALKTKLKAIHPSLPGGCHAISLSSW